MRTTVPPGLALLIDDMVGTIYGENRAEVLRFILQSWVGQNIQSLRYWADRREQFLREQQRAR